MRILILSPSVPFPADNGGKLRAAGVAHALAARHDVVVGCLAEPGMPVGRPKGTEMFREFKVVPRAARPSLSRRLLTRVPSDVHTLHSPELAAWAEETIARFSPDVLLAGDPALTPYVAAHTDRVRVLDYVCVATLQFDRLRALAPTASRPLWTLRRRKFAAYHARIAPVYDLCLVNSEEDRTALVAEAAPWRRIEFVPNGLDLESYPLGLAMPQPTTLVFHGAVTYAPNLDAIQHFAEEILPRVRAAIPEARLLVTGRVSDPRLTVQAPGVEYTGYVPDVRPVVAGAIACPVPLRAGAGGARFKILEALALGTPVISTTIGVEGLGVTHGRDVLLADEPAHFASHIVDVMQSPALRQSLSESGRRLIERSYDWATLGERIVSMVGGLVARRALVVPGSSRPRAQRRQRSPI